MNRAWRLGAALLIIAAVSLLASPASAVCNIATITSMSPATANTGTYTPPTAPTWQSVTLTIGGTYNSLLGGTCTLSISFNRASLPASMARTGGGATLPYTIQSAAGGGNTLLYTGGGVPPAANRLATSFSAGILGLGRPFSVNLTVYFLMQPGSPQLEGSYSDGITVHFFDGTGGGVSEVTPARAFTVTGTVAKACTIGGVYTPAADSATIPVGPTGIVNTTPIGKSYASAICNSLTNLQVTSQSGAVKRTAAAPGGFTNLINYTAAASYGGASSTLNTATIPTATGAEAGTIGVTSSSTSSGSISVTITPLTPSQNLVPGSYSDTLRVTLTPQ